MTASSGCPFFKLVLVLLILGRGTWHPPLYIMPYPLIRGYRDSPFRPATICLGSRTYRGMEIGGLEELAHDNLAVSRQDVILVEFVSALQEVLEPECSAKIT